MDEYMTASEAAEKWGLSPQRVRTLCKEGRIPGLMVMGRVYVIPAAAEKACGCKENAFI